MIALKPVLSIMVLRISIMTAKGYKSVTHGNHYSRIPGKYNPSGTEKASSGLISVGMHKAAPGNVPETGTMPWEAFPVSPDSGRSSNACMSAGSGEVI